MGNRRALTVEEAGIRLREAPKLEEGSAFVEVELLKERAQAGEVVEHPYTRPPGG
jgi:hypothetical protein